MGFDVLTCNVLVYVLVFAAGACFGSFSNVCILRIPEKQSIIPPSKCVYCGRKLRWYELIPIFSFLTLRGKCRDCKTPLSLQYPLIEGICAALWLIVYISFGIRQSGGFPFSVFDFEPGIKVFLMMFICFLASTTLMIIAVIDIRTMEIPPSLNTALLILGVFALAIDYRNWHQHLIGAVSVSGVLFILWFLTGGRALGGGDIKLMAVCGLLLGWKLIIVAFLLGCVIGSIVHVVRMLGSGAGRTLAFGPYLAAGVFISMICGETILNWYLGFFV